VPQTSRTCPSRLGCHLGRVTKTEGVPNGKGLDTSTNIISVFTTSIVSNDTISTDENGKIIIAFSPEWRLVQIAIRNYNSKLECSRRHYHKTKNLKGDRKLPNKTLLMEKYTQLSQLDDTQIKTLSCKNCETRIRRPHPDY